MLHLLVSQTPKFCHGKNDRPQHGDAHPLASGDGTGTQRGSDVEGAVGMMGGWEVVTGDVSDIYRNFTVPPQSSMGSEQNIGWETKWCILYLCYAFVSYYYDFPTAFWFAWIFWNHKGRWFVFSFRHKKLIIQAFLSLVVQVGEGSQQLLNGNLKWGRIKLDANLLVILRTFPCTNALLGLVIAMTLGISS